MRPRGGDDGGGEGGEEEEKILPWYLSSNQPQ